MLLRNIFLLHLALLLTGCMTSLKDVAKKNGLSSITVDQRVLFNERARFNQKEPGLVGLLYNSISDSVNRNKLMALTNAMEESKLEIDSIICASAAKEIQADGIMVSTNDHDAILSITVLQYGYDNAVSFTRELPFLHLEATLHKDGQVLWKGFGWADPRIQSGKNVGADWEVYLRDHDLLKRAWEHQAGIAMSMLIRADGWRQRQR